MRSTTMHTILIVDDIPVCQQFVATALQMSGYQTLCADDGTAALNLLESTPVNLVILDAQMPRMDGAGFLWALRHDARFLQLPVILLTALSSRDVVVRTRMLGAQDFLLKSKLKADELVARVKRQLAQSSFVPPVRMFTPEDGTRNAG